MSDKKWIVAHAHEVQKKDRIKVAGRKRKVVHVDQAEAHSDYVEIEFDDGSILTVDQFDLLEVKR